MKFKDYFKKYNIVDFSSEELNNFIKWSVIVCVGILSLFLLVKTISEIKNYAYIGEDQLAYSTISVNGKSEMYVLPDITTFSFTIEGKAKEIGESQKLVNDKSKTAIDLIKSMGVKEGDIKTIGYYTNTDYKSQTRPCSPSIAPSYRAMSEGGYTYTDSVDPSKPSIMASEPAMMPVKSIVLPCDENDQVPVGYTTTQSVEVKVRNIKDNPALVGTLIGELGRMSIKAGSPYSTVDNPEKYQSKVRQEAIIKARQEAEVLADALGVRLVEIIGFNDNANGGYPTPMYMSARAGDMAVKEVSNPELPTGSTLISSDVSVVFKIK